MSRVLHDHVTNAQVGDLRPGDMIMTYFSDQGGLTLILATSKPNKYTQLTMLVFGVGVVLREWITYSTCHRLFKVPR